MVVAVVGGVSLGLGYFFVLWRGGWLVGGVAGTLQRLAQVDH